MLRGEKGPRKIKQLLLSLAVELGPAFPRSEASLCERPQQQQCQPSHTSKNQSHKFPGILVKKYCGGLGFQKKKKRFSQQTKRATLHPQHFPGTAEVTLIPDVYVTRHMLTLAIFRSTWDPAFGYPYNRCPFPVVLMYLINSKCK